MSGIPTEKSRQLLGMQLCGKIGPGLLGLGPFQICAVMQKSSKFYTLDYHFQL